MLDQLLFSIRMRKIVLMLLMPGPPSTGGPTSRPLSPGPVSPTVLSAGLPPSPPPPSPGGGPPLSPPALLLLLLLQPNAVSERTHAERRTRGFLMGRVLYPRMRHEQVASANLL